MAEPITAVVTMVGVFGTLMMQCFQQMRYSRCTKIAMCGIEIDRDVIDVPQANTTA